VQGNEVIETIKLVPLQGDQRDERQTGPQRSVRTELRRWAWYIAVVIVPTLLTGLYFLLVAAPRYEAQATFVVRGAGNSIASQLAGLVPGSGVVRSTEDAYIVQAYLKSRDVVRHLQEEVDLLEIFNRSGFDFVWTFPGWLRTDTRERRSEHFQRLVSIDFDTTTGITTLKVQAFQPRDANLLAERLLARSESLVNNLSERALLASLRLAEQQAQNSRSRTQASMAKITEFRSRNAMLDPGKISEATMKTVGSLAVEIAKTNAELIDLERTAAQSPNIATLKGRIKSLDYQIQKERQTIAGSDVSLAPLLAEYEGLVQEREFSERAYATAQAALDFAKVDLQKQKLYLERISLPSLPDYPKYPHALLGLLIVFLSLQMIYFVLGLFISDTLTHNDR